MRVQVNGNHGNLKTRLSAQDVRQESKINTEGAHRKGAWRAREEEEQTGGACELGFLPSAAQGRSLHRLLSSAGPGDRPLATQPLLSPILVFFVCPFTKYPHWTTAQHNKRHVLSEFFASTY